MERQQEWHGWLKECNHSQESIKNIAEKYMQVGANERLAVAKTIENFMDFHLYELHHKMSVLGIVTELLNDPKKQYVLHLSSRILSFIRRHKHLILQDPQALSKLKKIISKWRNKRLFAQPFMTKFYDSAGRSLQAALSEQKESVNHFVRYSKTTVMCISDVRKHKVTALLYELKCRANKLSKQTSSLQKEQQQIQSSQAQAIQQQNQRHLLKITDNLINQHIQMLLDLQQGSQQLLSFFQSQTQAIEAYPTADS